MDQDQDLERGDLRQRRVNNRRDGTGLRLRRTVSEGASPAGTANFAAHLVSLVGLLFSLFSTLIGLIQVKYQNRDASPYKTHPLSMAFSLVALCICAFAIGFKMIAQTRLRNSAAHIINCAILISGLLVVVATVAVLVTNWLSWIIYIVWAIFSVMLVVWNWIHLIKQWPIYERTEKAFFLVIDVFRKFKQRLPMINVRRRMMVEPQGPSNV